MARQIVVTLSDDDVGVLERARARLLADRPGMDASDDVFFSSLLQWAGEHECEDWLAQEAACQGAALLVLRVPPDDAPDLVMKLVRLGFTGEIVTDPKRPRS